ncbi:MAG TPA: hypothetical protein VK403_12195 [Allosphingosinicella sp.]|nr:hypothetical protein [Allosphingosinicella sp.]
MRGRDFIVIPAAALAVMVLNVAIAFGIVWLYSTFLDPGQPASHYEAFATRAAPVSSVIAGIPLMIAAGFLLAKGRPGRSGLAAAAAAALFYIIVDTAILLSVEAGRDVWMWAALSHATKLLSALAGARLAPIRPIGGPAG